MRLTRDAWIDIALEALRDDGPEALTVAALCARTGRTRGSLYHHFQSHDALLDALIERWATRDTTALLDALDPVSAASLHQATQRLDPRMEQQIRLLVSRAPRLRPALAAVDQKRIATLVQLHAHHHPGASAEALAHIEYAAFLGFQQLHLDRTHLESLHRWWQEHVATPPDANPRGSHDTLS